MTNIKYLKKKRKSPRRLTEDTAKIPNRYMLFGRLHCDAIMLVLIVVLERNLLVQMRLSTQELLEVADQLIQLRPEKLHLLVVKHIYGVMYIHW